MKSRSVWSLIFANPLCLTEWAQRRLLRRAAGHLTGRVLDAGCGQIGRAHV